MSNKAVRDEYSEIGVEEYYKKHSLDYSNPHEDIIKKIILICEDKNFIGKKVLDLSCGSGEVSEVLLKFNHEIYATDPYTVDAYEKRIGFRPLKISFKDIVEGKLDLKVDTIICSFAMHLCEESMLASLLFMLSNNSKSLIIISPNKRPNLSNINYWNLIYNDEIDRVKFKVYKLDSF